MSKPNYDRIFKSSVMTGGAQVVTMGAAFVRLKIAALTIGVSGVGLLGLFTASTGMIAAIAGLGLNSSAVREVAAAEGSGEPEKLARVITALRMLVLGTGLLGAGICIALSKPLSVWTFGDESKRTSFMILGSALFLTEIASGQAALLRGLGKIRELALQSIVVSLVSSVGAGLLYWTLGEAGIVPSLVLVAAATLAGSWWFARQVAFQKTRLSVREIWTEGRGMLRMGLAFVWCAFAGSGVAYAVGIIVRDRLGIEGNGLYGAAWGVSGLFVGLVLSAMGRDFYPRLTGLIHKPEEASRLINEQTEIGILLALPGVVATVALSGWLIPLLYSREFLPAAGAVAWFSLGCFGRVVSWPLGYVLIARGESLWFAVTEGVFVALQFGFCWLGLKYHGLAGVAGGFAVTYFCYAIAMRLLVGRLLGFRYTGFALTLVLLGALAIVVAAFVGPWPGLMLTCAVSLLCLRGVAKLLGPDNPLLLRFRRLPFATTLLKGVV